MNQVIDFYVSVVVLIAAGSFALALFCLTTYWFKLSDERGWWLEDHPTDYVRWVYLLYVLRDLFVVILLVFVMLALEHMSRSAFSEHLQQASDWKWLTHFMPVIDLLLLLTTAAVILTRLHAIARWIRLL